MICGSCKQTEGVTVQHVKECFGSKLAVSVPAPAIVIPAARTKYAIMLRDELRYYEVKAGDRNKNIRFVNRLYGAPGDWRREKIRDWTQAHAIMELIKADAYLDEREDGTVAALSGPEAGAVRFSRTFTCCACCSSPLSRKDSRERGMGKDCWDKRFAA